MRFYIWSVILPDFRFELLVPDLAWLRSEQILFSGAMGPKRGNTMPGVAIAW